VLFLLFQLGHDRYALEATRVVEVLPLVELKGLPQAPPGVAGVFNYRGQPVPALDLCALTLRRPAQERLSTRILVVRCESGSGPKQLLGLIAERATEMMRCNPEEFVSAGLQFAGAPYLGPVLPDARGMIQWLRAERLLPESLREMLFAQAQLAAP
jgi:chemotaxis-related protein WspB